MMARMMTTKIMRMRIVAGDEEDEDEGYGYDLYKIAPPCATKTQTMQRRGRPKQCMQEPGRTSSSG